MFLAIVLDTASRTLGTGSQLRSNKCGITSVANFSGARAPELINEEHKWANACLRTQRFE